MIKIKHTLSDSDITTELSSRRKFLRGFALASAAAGLATLGVLSASAADNNDNGNDCNDGVGDANARHDRGGCTMQK